MNRIPASSPRAARALALVESLQSRFVDALRRVGGAPFESVEWFRDEGRHGGGRRFGVADASALARASVNVSQVHYDDDSDRELGSATAISTIVHPTHPRAPSTHIHVSWTEMKNGAGYWRMMADLNPSIPNAADTERFAAALRAAAPDSYEAAALQGDRYFFIPALERHRGVTHFYLEGYDTGDFAADLALAKAVGEAAVDTYIALLDDAPRAGAEATDAERAAQLAYHTLYFFQVLTLDRGTTTGLLVHDQNDVGVLGSLPPRIDKNLLASWMSRAPEPQDRLVEKLLAALPHAGVCEIDDAVKVRLAAAVRAHYQQRPDALALQAAGDSTPPTVANHR